MHQESVALVFVGNLAFNFAPGDSKEARLERQILMQFGTLIFEAMKREERRMKFANDFEPLFREQVAIQPPLPFDAPPVEMAA